MAVEAIPEYKWRTTRDNDRENTALNTSNDHEYIRVIWDTISQNTDL